MSWNRISSIYNIVYKDLHRSRLKEHSNQQTNRRKYRALCSSPKSSKQTQRNITISKIVYNLLLPMEMSYKIITYLKILDLLFYPSVTIKIWLYVNKSNIS